VGVLAVGVLALAGCGPAPTPARPGPPATSGTTAAAPSGLSIAVSAGPGRRYLVDNQGQTLYLFVLDSGGRSACTGTCAVAWPPLPGTAQLGPGVTGPLTTLTRDDGTTQAVYNGHPLYYFKNDIAPGTAKGEALYAAGGLWYVVDPAGNPITSLDTASPGGRP